MRVTAPHCRSLWSSCCCGAGVETGGSSSITLDFPFLRRRCFGFPASADTVAAGADSFSSQGGLARLLLLGFEGGAVDSGWCSPLGSPMISVSGSFTPWYLYLFVGISSKDLGRGGVGSGVGSSMTSTGRVSRFSTGTTGCPGHAWYPMWLLWVQCCRCSKLEMVLLHLLNFESMSKIHILQVTLDSGPLPLSALSAAFSNAGSRFCLTGFTSFRFASLRPSWVRCEEPRAVDHYVVGFQEK